MKISLSNIKTCQKTGIFVADVLCDGHLEAKKTFFPCSWSRADVIKKIAEAAQNPIDIPVIKGTRFSFLGETPEGIIIRIVADIKSGEYITAFPDRIANGL